MTGIDHEGTGPHRTGRVRRWGTFGLAARRVEDGAQILAGEPDRLFQLASVFKVPVLATLEARAAAGEISWQDRTVLSDAVKSPGSGILVDMEPGLSLDLEDLARLMMTLSDNTAADLCVAVAGVDRIRETQAAWGVAPMSVVCDCTALLADYVGVPVEAIVAADPAGKQALLEPEDDATRTAAFSQDMTRTNLATPRSVVDLPAGVGGGRFLPRPAAAHMMRIMGLECYRHRIPARLPPGVRWATKSGTLGSVVNDTGILFTPRGAVALAMFSTGLENPEPWEPVIARAAEVVYESLGR